MSTEIKTKYGSAGQSIVCTLASLTNTSRRQSDAIDNTSNLFLDVLVSIAIKTGASGTSSFGYIEIFAYASVDGGSTYTGSASGSDGGITLTVPPNVRLIGVINAVANATTYRGGPFSVAQAFGGVLPAFWGIIIGNQSGGTLDSTEGNHAKTYQGILAQSV